MSFAIAAGIATRETLGCKLADVGLKIAFGRTIGRFGCRHLLLRLLLAGRHAHKVLRVRGDAQHPLVNPLVWACFAGFLARSEVYAFQMRTWRCLLLPS